MLLCYLPNRNNPDEPPSLFIVPDKADPLATPAKLRTLDPRRSIAVYRVSSEETFVLSIDDNDNQMVISAMEPTPFYLTANLNEKPGYRVRRVKYSIDAEGVEHVYCARERGGWEEWIAGSAKV
jgi:hypothetical protein